MAQQRLFGGSHEFSEPHHQKGKSYVIIITHDFWLGMFPASSRPAPVSVHTSILHVLLLWKTGGTVVKGMLDPERDINAHPADL
jgi:hypothetical protein